jgi:micrococcal nuclease
MEPRKTFLILLLAFLALAAAKPFVKKVYDGDTVVLSTGEQVRYLGVDAPEMDHQGGMSEFMADEAKKMNAALVQGKPIRLEFDEERRDHHGRLLAYVFLENRDMVNAVLVRKGFARVLPKPPNLKYFGLLLDSQRQAMIERVGIWQKEPERPECYYIGNMSSYRFHRPSCPLGRTVSGHHRVRFDTTYKAYWEGLSPCRQCKP